MDPSIPRERGQRCFNDLSSSSRGATRSSTCQIPSASQGTSSSASAMNICLGVVPPDTAIAQPPRSRTASRAAAAISSAPRRAAAAASGSASS